MLKIDAATDWARFGRDDPYYGVLSHDRYRGSRIDAAAKRDFLASGTWHVDRLIAEIERTFGETPRGSALDFGCGVGRLSQALATRFRRVVGVDIAPGMLAEAERNAAEAGLDNLTYGSSLDPALIAPGRYDLVHSYIVLQHIPVAVGEPAIAKLIDAVAVGGVGALHLTIAPATGRRRIALRNWVKRNRAARALSNLALGRPWHAPAMEMNLYRIERIVEILARSGIHRFTSLRIDDWGSVGLFILFRREPGDAAAIAWSNPRTA